MDTGLIKKTINGLSVTQKTTEQEISVAVRTFGFIEGSMYIGDVVTKEEGLEIGTHLMAAFPNVTQQFVCEMVRIAMSDGLTKARLSDSVDNLIRNHKYPTVTISDVINFDVKLKLYSYKRILKEEGKFDDDTLTRYAPYRRIDNMMLYAKIEDVYSFPEKFRRIVLAKIEQTRNELKQ